MSCFRPTCTTYNSIVPLVISLTLTMAMAGSANAASATFGALPYAQSSDQHFHPKGKPPSEHTLKVIRKARETMPFADKRDFEEAKKGFIAPLNSKIIKADAGHVAWDIERYEFFNEGRDFDSIHPSLQRQSTLNQIIGLFEVIPGIYQVRGLDLANITFMRGKMGWIVFDPLTARETARAGAALCQSGRDDQPDSQCLPCPAQPTGRLVCTRLSRVART